MTSTVTFFIVNQILRSETTHLSSDLYYHCFRKNEEIIKNALFDFPGKITFIGNFSSTEAMRAQVDKICENLYSLSLCFGQFKVLDTIPPDSDLNASVYLYDSLTLLDGYKTALKKLALNCSASKITLKLNFDKSNQLIERVCQAATGHMNFYRSADRKHTS